MEEKMIKTVDSTGTETVTTSSIKGSVNSDGDFVYDLGAMGKLKLADGTELTVGGNSAEKKLVDFINDASKAVDKTTWFTMDRLYFETGKSVLKPGSKQQLTNIATILKANPAVELKIGGYTDNTGDSAANLVLSRQRAESAKAELVKLGVDTKRLDAEGYGPQYPVASNSNTEGKAQNTRIDVRVTKK
jgi:OmpA-OmpF porin, OOP family